MPFQENLEREIVWEKSSLYCNTCTCLSVLSYGMQKHFWENHFNTFQLHVKGVGNESPEMTLPDMICVADFNVKKSNNDALKENGVCFKVLHGIVHIQECWFL